MKTKIFLVLFSTLANLAYSSESYSERLNIYQMPNNVYLFNFTYNFKYDLTNL